MTSLLTQLDAFLTTSDDVVEALSDGDKGSVIVPNTLSMPQWVVSRVTRVS